jgi:nitronate monooxygenase
MILRPEPVIIQGGMGAAVSSWQLARAVSQIGQMGVVSGTGLDVVLSRRLQLGDADGALRRAMAEFPLPEMIDPILDRYFIPGGKAPEKRFISCPMPSMAPSQRHFELLVVSNFVEVYLAKEDHDGLVGINYLEKIQVPTPASLFGAMLADVDYVLMGAGIPRAIPGILDRLSQSEPVEMPVNVYGADRDDNFVTRFDPEEFTHGDVLTPKRPKFLAIVASQTLATMLARKSTGRVDGFVVEGPTAGGHNAPPRGAMQLNDRAEPIYGDRDVPDLEVIRSLELPFWLAGSYGTPQRVIEALDVGATGVQVGTAFAFCEESGLRADIKQRVLAMVRAGTVDVRTDPRASPAGFPFKVLGLSSSMSEEAEYSERKRICDLGFLRHAYKRSDGSIGWRCSAEEIEAFVRKGGDEADTCGRKCVCNGLIANIGLEQVRGGGAAEKPLVTSGDEVRNIARFLPTPDDDSYSAKDVVEHLLVGITTSV